MTDEHLTVSTSQRGFDATAPIRSEYGGQIRAHESSAAMAPHLWLTAEAPVNLNDPDGPKVEAPLHLTCDNAWRFAEQVMVLVADHYHGDHAHLRPALNRLLTEVRAHGTTPKGQENPT